MIRTFIGGVAHGQQKEVPDGVSAMQIFIDPPLTAEQLVKESETLSTEKRTGPVHLYRAEIFHINARREYLMVHEKIEKQNVFGLLVASAVKERSYLDKLKEIIARGDAQDFLNFIKERQRQ